MRALIAVVAACGSAGPSTSGSTTPTSLPRQTGVTIAPTVDPFAALAESTSIEASWLVPGTVRFETTGAAFDAPPGAPPIEVGVVDEQGNLVRVAVRLDHARFLVWSDRDRMFAIVTRDQRVSESTFESVPSNGGVEVVIRAGAHVRRLAHKDAFTQIRYFGGVEVDGWVPDAALAEHRRGGPRSAPAWSGGQRMMLMPGAIIRAEPKWASRELALMANNTFIDKVNRLDDEWSEVRYADVDVVVHGFVSQRLPPGALHRPLPLDPPPTPIAPTDMVPSGTCLYAHDGGDPIGYLVGDQRVELAPGDRLGWWKLAIDTPWGATTFVAQGAMKLELLPCAVPATTPTAP